jgi:hypothetical protein
LLIFNEVPGLQMFLFSTLKLIGPCRNADFLAHGFFLKLAEEAITLHAWHWSRLPHDQYSLGKRITLSVK